MSAPVQYIGTPMEHQIEAINKAWPRDSFALFHEMGTGKTYTSIHLAVARYRAGQIDQLYVICPNSIQSVWYNTIDGGELAKWIPKDVKWRVEYGSTPSLKPFDGLTIYLWTVEGFGISDALYNMAVRLIKGTRTMIIVDESSRIKNPKSQRTKRIAQLGGLAHYRLAMTGTPITEGTEDLFGQFMFLGTVIIGCKNFFVFKNRYCQMGGYMMKEIVGYQFLDDLMRRILPYVHVVEKAKCMTLPPKVFQKIVVEPTQEQKRILKDLKKMFEAEHDGAHISVESTLEQMTRYQQVIGGMFPHRDEGDEFKYRTKPIAGKNPKLDALMGLVELIPHTGKIVIWARFRPEIELIRHRLVDEYGGLSVVEFHGGIDKEIRTQNVLRFRKDKNCRFFISNQQSGGIGLTLVEANYVIYYSNSFSYEDRAQSEDRTHRKGQTNSVTYYDIEMNVAADIKILRAVEAKTSVAKIVGTAMKTGDLSVLDPLM